MAILNGTAGDDFLLGTADSDQITGGDGSDILAGGLGQDTLTGGAGRGDAFQFSGDPFAGGTPAPGGTTGINVVNLPDTITDYEIGVDAFTLDGLGLSNLSFQSGASASLTGASNALVLTGETFAAAAAAAKAIADNPNVTAGAGVFVYANSTLGFNRLVFSEDLANGGDISVLGNLTSQTGQAGIDSLATFTANDFRLNNDPASTSAALTAASLPQGGVSGQSLSEDTTGLQPSTSLVASDTTGLSSSSSSLV